MTRTIWEDKESEVPEVFRHNHLYIRENDDGSVVIGSVPWDNYYSKEETITPDEARLIADHLIKYAENCANDKKEGSD